MRGVRRRAAAAADGGPARRGARALLDVGLGAHRARPRGRDPAPLSSPSTPSARSSAATKAPPTPVPPDRLAVETSSPRSRGPGHRHLHRRGRPSSSPSAATRTASRSSPAASTSTASPAPRSRMRPTDRRSATPRRPFGRSLGRLVPRKGFGTAIEALPQLPDTELVIAGGPEQARMDGDPEVTRLLALAGIGGVADRVRLLAQCRGPSCRACCAPPTSSPAPPGTSRSASCPWRRWPAAARWWPAQSAGLLDTVVDRHTGRLVPPRDPALSPTRARGARSDPEAAALATAGPRWTGSQQLYSWDRASPPARRLCTRPSRGAPAGGCDRRPPASAG